MYMCIFAFDGIPYVFFYLILSFLFVRLNGGWKDFAEFRRTAAEFDGILGSSSSGVAEGRSYLFIKTRTAIRSVRTARKQYYTFCEIDY